MTVTDKYFPFDIEGDLERLGLEYVKVPTRLGTLRLARSRTEGEIDTLFLHGAGLDSSAWSPLLRAAHASTDTKSWIFLDLPGYGGSTDVQHSFSLDEVSAAIVEVLAAVNAPPVHLVGYSMGGFLALHLAASRPDSVRQLTVVCGAYGTIVDVANSPFRTLLRSPRTAATYLAMSALAGLGRVGTLMLRVAAATGVLRLSLAGVAAHPLRLPGSMLRAIARGNRPRSFLYARATAAGYDYRRTWSRITVPVLAIFGSSDSLVTKRDASVLASALPGSRNVFINDASHFAPMEQPFALLDVILCLPDV